LILQVTLPLTITLLNGLLIVLLREFLATVEGEDEVYE
jgi:hypothetical protein